MKKYFCLVFIGFSLNATAQALKDCSACSAQIIKTTQIKDLSIDEIRYLMNDLFARKGYKFKSGEIDFYFSNKAWYKPIENNAKIVYNETEKKNIKTFQDRTSELKLDREKLIADLKEFKQAFLQNDKDILKLKFNYVLEKEYSQYFSQVLNKVNLDDIHWFKQQGHYKLIVDNLTETIGYKVFIQGNQIHFSYDYDTGSEDVEDDLYPSDYYTEFTHLWEFEWKNNKLKFIRINSAG